MKVDNIQQWLASSQRNVPYELDFFTPFKEMADARPQPKPKPDHSKRKHGSSKLERKTTPITISSTEESGSSSASSSSSQKYQKQPRHKTRNDRYDYKATRPRQKTVDKSEVKADRKRHKKQKKRVKRDVASQFVARNVASDRLTLRKPSGLFQRGKASAPVARPGLQDLTFSERAFLKLKQGNDTGKSTRVPEEEPSHEARPSNREQKEREKDAQISQYFRQPLASEGQNDHRLPHSRTRDGPRQFIVQETPCRQKQKTTELTSPAYVDLRLPGPPYLGFGERRLDAGPNSSLRRTTVPLIPHKDEPIQSCYRAGRQRAHDHSSTFRESKSSPNHANSTIFDADSRAMHSPTSNLNFARNQRARLQRLQRGPARSSTPGRQSESPERSRQDEIIRLLNDLQQSKTSRSAGSQNKAGEPERAGEAVKTPGPVAEEPGLLLGSLKKNIEALRNVDQHHPILHALGQLLNTASVEGAKVNEKTSCQVALTEGVLSADSTGTHSSRDKVDPKKSLKSPDNDEHEEQGNTVPPREEIQGAVRPDAELGTDQGGSKAPAPENDFTRALSDDELQMQPSPDEAPDSNETSNADGYAEPSMPVSGLESLPMIGALQTAARPVSDVTSYMPYHDVSPWPSIYAKQAHVDKRRTEHSKTGLLSPANTYRRPLTPVRPYSPHIPRRPGTAASHGAMLSGAIGPFSWNGEPGFIENRCPRTSSAAYGPSAMPHHAIRTDAIAPSKNQWLEDQALFKDQNRADDRPDLMSLEGADDIGSESSEQDYRPIGQAQIAGSSRHNPHIELPIGLRDFWQPNRLY